MDWYEALQKVFESGSLSYFIVFGVLILCGIGLPIPEEATFIVAGIVVKNIDGSLGIMIAFSLVGILAGDSVTFFLGRRYGEALLTRWPFNKFITEKGLQRSKDFFRKHGSKTIAIAGCIAGVRAPTFFLCGTMGFRYGRFLLWDGARAVITCPVSILLGYYFGKAAEEHLGPYKHYFFGVVGVLVVFFVVREVLAHRREIAAAPVATETAPQETKSPAVEPPKVEAEK